MFDYRGSDLNPTDGLSIRKNRNTKYLHELNGKQGTGEWNKGGSRNEPVLYIANQQNVTIMVRFQASDPCVTTADMSAIAQSQPPLLPNVKKTTVNFVNGISGNGGPDTDAGSYVTMTLDRATDNMLNKVAETWRWMTENVNGYGAAAVQTDMSGPHTVYTVLAAPGLPWYAKDNGMVKEGTVAWTDALDFVMDAVNAKGKASPADATSAITQWLFSSFLLRYDTVNKGTPAYTEGKTGSPIFDLARFITLPHYAIVNCDDMAAAVSTLSNLVGAYAQFNFMKPFGYINTTALIGVGQNNSPYFENIIFKTTPLTPIVQPPGSCREDSFIDNAPPPPPPRERSFFSNPAFLILNEKVFDPTPGPPLGPGNLQGYFKKVIDTSPDIRSPTFVHVMDPQRGVLLVRVCTIETGTKANVTPGTVTLDTP